MRVGILGGTFDPPHVGHLLAASDAYEQLQLDRVLFVPAAQQPLKTDRATAAAADRLAMTRAAIGADARFEVSAIEIDRAGLSFTVDTLLAMAEQRPNDTRYLLLGADVLRTFSQWRSPERVLELATLAVFERADGDGAAGERGARAAWDALRNEWYVARGTFPEHEPVFVALRRIDVSSSEIRSRVAAGRSIHGFVPEAVAAYAAEQRLYL
ncbi:MAG: nicotinate-nucleotide adenylyltransferase [Gemmatimonadaceae bacterium]